MEFFIMALLANAHLASLYDFQQRAGLQPGGIRPALQRLERAGLITRAQASKRKRKALALTQLGSQVLYDSWRECLRDYPDTESVLRGACVALLISGRKSAAEYLELQSSIRRHSAEEKRMEAERLEKTQRDPLSTYAWMRVLNEAQRRSGEYLVFASLSGSLREKLQPDVIEQG